MLSAWERPSKLMVRSNHLHGLALMMFVVTIMVFGLVAVLTSGATASVDASTAGVVRAANLGALPGIFHGGTTQMNAAIAVLVGMTVAGIGLVSWWAWKKVRGGLLS